MANIALDPCNLLAREPIAPLVQRRERRAHHPEVAGIMRLARWQVPDEALGLGIPGKTREIEKLSRRGLQLLAELFIDHHTVSLAARHVVMDPLIADHPLKNDSLLIASRFQIFRCKGVVGRLARRLVDDTRFP